MSIAPFISPHHHRTSVSRDLLVDHDEHPPFTHLLPTLIAGTTYGTYSWGIFTALRRTLERYRACAIMPRRKRSGSNKGVRTGKATTQGDSFGMLLKRHRVAAGLSQEALAERAALSARAVSDL